MTVRGQKKIIIIGPFSGPITGESYALKMLISSALSRTFTLICLDRNTLGKSPFAAGCGQIALFIKFIHLLFTRRPDVLYFSMGQSSQGVARDTLLIFFAQLFRVPLVGHLHGGGLARHGRSTLFSLLAGYIVRHLKVAVALGESLKDQFYQFSKTVDVCIVHNTCEAPIDVRSNLLSRNRQPQDELRLFFLSNVMPEKGLFVVLEALAVLKQRNVPFRFKFAGHFLPLKGITSRMLSERTTDTIRHLKIEQECEIVGPVGYEEKWRLLIWADALLLPTMLLNEGQPIVLIEGMHAGCVLVASRFGGIVDLIEEGVNGFMITPGALALADKLEWMHRHPQWMAEASQKNIHKARQEFSQEAYVANMTSIFTQVLKNKQKND